MMISRQKMLAVVPPWWRQSWPWLLMAGPAVAIVGCAITIILAFQGFSDQPIVDGGVKHGLVVEKNVKPTTSQPH